MRKLDPSAEGLQAPDKKRLTSRSGYGKSSLIFQTVPVVPFPFFTPWTMESQRRAGIA
jgi:hypothetical protein